MANTYNMVGIRKVTEFCFIAARTSEQCGGSVAWRDGKWQHSQTFSGQRILFEIQTGDKAL